MSEGQPNTSGKPISVRELLSVQAPDSGAGQKPAGEIERSFEYEGDRWVVRVSGRSVSGREGGGGAPLMSLTFTRSGNVAPPPTHVISAGGSIEWLSEAELGGLLKSSRVWLDPPRKQAAEKRGGGIPRRG